MDNLTKNITFGAIALIVLKEVASFLKEMFSNQHKKNTEALERNTLAIIELKVKLEFLQKALDKLPELERDLSVAHSKIRNLQERI